MQFYGARLAPRGFLARSAQRSVRAGKAREDVIEAAVLLHHDDDVLNVPACEPGWFGIAFVLLQPVKAAATMRVTMARNRSTGVLQRDVVSS